MRLWPAAVLGLLTTLIGGEPAQARECTAASSARADLPLFAALVQAGGGVGAFEARRLERALTPDGLSAAVEQTRLEATFGHANVMSFESTLAYAMNDALSLFARTGVELPAPMPADSNALGRALYAAGDATVDAASAGVTPQAQYDVDRMLDGLLSHAVHEQVRSDIDANPELGSAADANFHFVLARLIEDLESPHPPRRRR